MADKRLTIRLTEKEHDFLENISLRIKRSKAFVVRYGFLKFWKSYLARKEGKKKDN